MTIGALSGFTVAVTADRRREEQAELIARRGGTVLHGPVITTLPLHDHEALRRRTVELVDHPPDVVVLTTGLGARGWFSAVESDGLGEALRDALAPAEVLARGPKAAGAAVTAGLQVDWVAPEATSEELLAHLAGRPAVAEDGRPVRVAVQLDGGPDPLVADALAARGFDVVAVPVYAWLVPEDLTAAERLVLAVADRTVDAVTFTCAHAVTNFMTIAESLGAADRVRSAVARQVLVACVGPVTATRARSLGLVDPVEPAHPRLGAMVQALTVALAGRSRTLDLAGASLVLQGRMVVGAGDDPVWLTDRERAVLDALTRRPGAVVSKQALLQQIWADGSDDHAVEVTVGRLRRRLGPVGEAIETVVRRGYRLTAT